MTRHPHTILVALISAASISLGIVTTSWTFPALIWIVLALHILFGLHLQSKPDLLRKVALGIPFAIWFRLLSHNGVHEGFTHMVQVDVLFMVGFYALAYSTYHLLCVPATLDTRGQFQTTDNVPAIAGADIARHAARSTTFRAEAMGGAVVAIALAGVLPKTQMMGSAGIANTLLGIMLVFVLLVFIELRRGLGVLYARGKPSHLIRQGVALAIMLGVAVFIQEYLVLRVPQLHRALSRKLPNTQTNANVSFRKFTTLGSLSLKTDGARANEIVVTLWAETPFPYLRGGVNDRYENRQWSPIQENLTAKRVAERDGRTVFTFKNIPNEAYVGTIYTSPEYKDTLFLPLGTFRVSAFADKVFYSTAYSAQVPDVNSVGGYGFYEPGIAKNDALPTSKDSDNYTDYDLQIPAAMREPIRKIALSIMDPNETPGKNALALQRYFEKNFAYSTTIQLKTGKNPILEFLEDRKAGHCEYFASATTLLLRAINIPARYVTGYVAQERGLNDSCFIARRKDAHAWVEMYTKEGGWKTVEATPAEGVPAPNTPGLWDRLTEYVSGTWERVLRVVQFGGLRAVFSNAGNLFLFIAEVVPLWGWILMAFIGFIWSQRDRIGRITKRSKEIILSRQARALQKELLLAERRLAKHGIRRAVGTPVGRFIGQVRAASSVPEQVRVSAIATMERYLAHRFRESHVSGHGE